MARSVVMIQASEPSFFHLLVDKKGGDQSGTALLVDTLSMLEHFLA
jgi:hypothetical protein